MSDRLHAFARAVASRQTEVDVVDQATLDAIAKDLGMTDDEILAARAEGQARKDRARGLRQRSLLDEAIAELEQAAAWNPLDVEVLTMLADTYVRRGRKRDDVADLERGRDYALQALKVAPANTEAPAILQTIKMNPAGQRSSLPVGVVVGLVAALVIIAFALVALL